MGILSPWGNGYKFGSHIDSVPNGGNYDGPVGMIFIPSVGGISHSPKEFSKGVDIGNGANVLLQTLLAIDRGN